MIKYIYTSIIYVNTDKVKLQHYIMLVITSCYRIQHTQTSIVCLHYGTIYHICL